ncbi:hypothetical protein ACLI09_17725 [Flavobacterium sp. RHBU_24]|uniref:hypothetical protein n=1 Tax=Flavobacterium sp. RHBU_24 TaxID=3391185 RepID=UPI003984B818
MRILNFIAGLAMLMAGTGCSDDDAVSNVNGNATAITNNMKSGTWRITNYVDSGNNETSDFTGYNFDFNDNGTLTASNGANTYSGSWLVTDSDSSDDDNDSSDIDFNLAFTAPDYFAELTDDWDVVERSGTRVVLQDVSGGNGDTDYLTFEKN